MFGVYSDEELQTDRQLNHVWVVLDNVVLLNIKLRRKCTYLR